ncbi:hypothetical protein CEE37_05985 [candidate division LCP-89 bacterium B3_LCP]|uniref:Uncharacterized protein n=1 Tax=candidate division LCP-89 bacterium B3_LCP TaxID=2012998 RepID=A0A532V249_UNCL8|nr:MAG: hypothetical protein CEE37_05985 [candidate division LCP-89 bacterium B3_LCP]
MRNDRFAAKIEGLWESKNGEIDKQQVLCISIMASGFVGMASAALGVHIYNIQHFARKSKGNLGIFGWMDG